LRFGIKLFIRIDNSDILIAVELNSCFSFFF